MFKAISGALSFFLLLLVLKCAFPEISGLMTQIIIQTLSLISRILEQAQTSM